MSFDIHGFDAATQSTDSTGVIVFRFGGDLEASAMRALAEPLVDAGVLVSADVGETTGSMAAFAWRVPSEDEQAEQKKALASAERAGVVEAWAFGQSTEVDLTDWFAPRWRVAPPTPAGFKFEVGPLPEIVTWEGFGLSLRFDHDIGDSETGVIRAIADLWLAGFTDRSAAGTLGARCYRRSVVARRGGRRVVVGVEGLANPGTDGEASGHALWLASLIASVLPVTSAEFLSLLPQDGESSDEDDDPRPRSERATREWQEEQLRVGDDTSIETMSVNALIDGSDEDDDDFGRAATKALRRDDVAAAIETLDASKLAAADEAAVPEAADETEDDGWGEAETAHLKKKDVAAALAALEGKKPDDADDDWGVAETAHLQRDEVEDALAMLDEVDDEAPASDGVTNGVSEAAVEDSHAALTALAEATEAGDLPALLAAYDSIVSPITMQTAAEHLLEIADSLDPEDWDDIPTILELTRRVIPTEPESSSGHLLAIAALCRLGKGNEAIELGLAHRHRPEVLFELYERLCVFRRTDETPALHAALAEHGHEGVGAHYYNLGCKLHASQPDVALALYRGAIAIGSPSPQSEINAGIALISLGRSEEALSVTREALAANGGEPNLWANLIDLETRTGAPELATSLASALEVIGNSSRCPGCDHAAAPAACPTGCAALLADCVDAMGAAGATDALALIERHTGEDGTQTLRVLCARAQALALSGDLTAARELLDHRISTDDANSGAHYRARANVEFLAGNEQVAAGLAIAAMHVDTQVGDQLQRDPIAALVATLPAAAGDAPPRPPTVPEGARWIASDNEWEVGDVDAAGAKQGGYRYYRPDGTLCNECSLVDDAPHGPFVRYHESGEVSQQGTFEHGALHGTRVWIASNVTSTEQMHGAQISPRIRRSEMDYVGGRVVEVRHYNADGDLCAPNGEPYPDRPENVAAAAFFRADERQWVAGEVDEAGQRRGQWQVWGEDGTLLEESEYQGGERHGVFKAYFADGTLSAEGQYEAGEKRGTFVYQRRGAEEHEDFPVCAPSIVMAEESYDTQIPAVRVYDNTGRETTIDGTPLEEWASVHPTLSDWYNEVWQVPWPELDDASGNAHRLPHILVGLMTVDEAISDFVYQAMYWHLYNQGNVYSGTAAALPFMIRLCADETTPHRAALCNFIRHAGVYPAEALEEAAAAGDHAVVSTNEALMKRLDVFVGMLSAGDPDVRAAAGAIVAGTLDRVDEMMSELAGALGNEEDPMVRASHMFSMARFATPDALFVVEAQVEADAPLVGAAASMALVMARGDEAGPRVANRLVRGLVEYTDDVGEGYARSPWSDDHIVTEMAQALHYACEDMTALDKLCAVFGSIETDDGIAAVAAALMIAISASEGLSEELQQVLTAIVETDSLWLFGDTLTNLLEGYELPTDRTGLRELLS